MLLLIEFGLCAAAVVLAFCCPRFGNRWFTIAEQRLTRFASRRHLAVLAVLLLALGLRLAILPIEPIPIPGIHDEFSYLLMADTFAHGRLTNPPHRMWEHFETFHVNQLPTYCSKYFPAQGIVLAFGRVALGHPYWGVWLSTGLMCAAICWALQGWMPPFWAFVAGIIAILRLGLFSYWANSYWGGSVAAIGGALVLGALPRIKRRGRIRDPLLMAVGLAILGASRPYEGFMYSLPLLIALLLWCVRTRKFQPRQLIRLVALPMVFVLICGFGLMGHYFWRTTGSPIQTPYSVYSARYDGIPFLPWLKVRQVPPYHHPVMEDFYQNYSMQQYQSARSGTFEMALAKFLMCWLFFMKPALSLPIIVVACLLPRGFGMRQLSSKARILIAVNVISFLCLLPIIYFHFHYAAPMVAAFYALTMLCMRRIWISSRRGGLRSKFVVRAIVAVCFLVAIVKVFTFHSGGSRQLVFDGWFPTVEQTRRAPLLAKLRQMSGNHLVLVRYKPGHNPHVEWVYNDADIDAAKVVWARDMGPAQNADLLNYFRGRRIWLAEPDEVPVKLTPYTEVQSSLPDERIPADAQHAQKDRREDHFNTQE